MVCEERLLGDALDAAEGGGGEGRGVRRAFAGDVDEFEWVVEPGEGLYGGERVVDGDSLVLAGCY